jgi:hypothetical protein
VTDLPSPSVVAPGSDVGSVVLSSGFTVSSVVVCCSIVLVVIFSSSFGVVLAVVSLASVLCVVTGVGKVSVVEDVVGFTVFFVVGFVVVDDAISVVGSGDGDDAISVVGSGDGSVSFFDVTCDVEGASVVFDSSVLLSPAQYNKIYHFRKVSKLVFPLKRTGVPSGQRPHVLGQLEFIKGAISSQKFISFRVPQLSRLSSHSERRNKELSSPITSLRQLLNCL